MFCPTHSLFLMACLSCTWSLPLDAEMLRLTEFEKQSKMY